MPLLQTPGNTGFLQEGCERPFIILMPTDIASVINGYVPKNKYRNAFYTYCISVVTEYRFVQACAFNMQFEHGADQAIEMVLTVVL